MLTSKLGRPSADGFSPAADVFLVEDETAQSVFRIILHVFAQIACVGGLPGTVAEWIALCHSVGLRPIGLSHPTLTPVTLRHVRHGWIAVYNRDGSPESQMRMLAQVISDFLLATLPELIDRQPIGGGSLPAWRGKVSEHVVLLCFRK